MYDIDIDKIVDYKKEYSSVLKGIKYNGNRIQAICPFHTESGASFSVDLISGKHHCFGCGAEGNYIDFVARYDGISTKDAYAKILRSYNIEPPSDTHKSSASSEVKSFTLDDYSKAKGLPIDFLRERCGLDTLEDRNHVKYLNIPYYKEDGSVSTCRRRYADKEFRWRYGSSGKICLYGEHLLSEIRKVGYAILVEGESDTQSLWYMEQPAIGVAGASMFKVEQVEKLKGLKLYIHKEADTGGDTFLMNFKRKLVAGGFDGEVYVFSCKDFDVKDPSDLFQKYGKDDATNKIRTLIKNAVRLDITEGTSKPINIEDVPRQLLCPAGYDLNEAGIYTFDMKTGSPILICRTPIEITQRLVNIDTGEEKIEIAYFRDKEWQRVSYPRSQLFRAQSITILADLGCTVTSENAKPLVKFLGALEAENYDLIEKAQSTHSFGWQGDKSFIPGNQNNIVLDIDPSQRSLAAAYSTEGTLEGWINTMKPHRERNKFRFILASSFAAPLLRIVKQRIFFVYNWGNSKGGKTAGLKAALSAWGDPDRLMVNFNATQVALERMAAFYCDLPLCIDERQLAGNNQGGLEKIVYMIASGMGRARGSKNGGLQQTSVWRTIALATGEEPLSTDTSQTGVNTRVIELYGGPFEDEKQASDMHQASGVNYGHAGLEYISKLIQESESSIRSQYDALKDKLSEKSGSKSGSHLANIAVVTLADILVDRWLFGGSNSEERAIEMALEILDEQAAAEVAGDVNENAKQFIIDWILSSKNCFGKSATNVCYGDLDTSTGKAYIYSSVLNDVLKREHFSPRKTLKYFADVGFITTSFDRGHIINTVNRRVNGIQSRVVEVNLPVMELLKEAYSPTTDTAQPVPTVEPAQSEQYPQMEMDLPFIGELPEEWR